MCIFMVALIFTLLSKILKRYKMIYTLIAATLTTVGVCLALVFEIKLEEILIAILVLSIAELIAQKEGKGEF